MKVFISSTYEDLKEVRRVVANAILDAGMEPILFEGSDIRYDIAESIKAVIDSADIFLMILGFR